MTATLISRQMLADRWGKSSRTIRRLELAPPPGFPVPVAIGGRWHYRVAEVEAFERALPARLPEAA